MSDLALIFGADLQLAPDGDLALAKGAFLTDQRVVRRLLTNKGDYIWQPSYGAGLAQFIGRSPDTSELSGIVRSQLTHESRVAATPPPQINVTADRGGIVAMTLQYTDAATSQTNAATLPI